jgi:hypothetical protein
MGCTFAVLVNAAVTDRLVLLLIALIILISLLTEILAPMVIILYASIGANAVLVPVTYTVPAAIFTVPDAVF